MWTTDRLLGWAPWLCWALSALALTPVLHRLGSLPTLAAATRGLRGQRRTEARMGASFRALEPLLLRLGGLVSGRLPARFLARAESWIAMASHPWGLAPEELLVLSLACAVACPWLAWCAGSQPLVVCAAVPGGAVLPVLRLREVARQRAQALARGLPFAMDICVLCMGAGADFPAALGFAVRELETVHPVCAEELAMVLDELALGRTRVAALVELGARTASTAVRDFVAAVCQSEEKGTPVVDALALQATVLRAQRSIHAEELAAKTAVRLTIPLMMTLVVIMLILFGPFVVRGGF